MSVSFCEGLGSSHRRTAGREVDVVEGTGYSVRLYLFLGELGVVALVKRLAFLARLFGLRLMEQCERLHLQNSSDEQGNGAQHGEYKRFLAVF
uniref:AlNc14C200G8662 protein n=1 Tax=Albugo laibachii Nc14 TaxID=890382 RepID=F0WQJ2_9STRA|nr:AlNc14C200G8662 [Albugo laibachii Nc14]CCA24164.1 AlNc14C224G9185 [Albugo laibachii Nc14]|eukprot:CCA24164.1 AlNc14C224G9185 [Albugo laibachii Nc14]